MRDLTNKNILITGAAGFVPSFTVDFYLASGAKVYGVDNFATGSENNLRHLSNNTNFIFEKADISSSIPSFGGIKFDYIFNLASPASPLDFDTMPVEIMMVNSIGVKNALDLAREHNARFLQASTSEVYGDPQIHPQTEDYRGNVSITGPRSCYDESKRFGEAMTSTYQRQFKLNTRIVRIFNTYGPRMRTNDGRVIPNFINQALTGKDVTIYGDGSQTRSFCYVTDLVQAFDAVMFSDDPTPFNIGNPDEYTIKEIAQLIIKALGSSSAIVFKDLPQDDPKQRKPCIKKLTSVTQYRPKVSFEEGLTLTANYFKSLS